VEALPPAFFERGIPFLIPENARPAFCRREGWYIFGALPENRAPGELPAEPGDPFAVYGAIPGKPETLARAYTLQAYILEALSWLALLAGVGLNAFFIQMILDRLF
jgi:hypothetical protein